MAIRPRAAIFRSLTYAGTGVFYHLGTRKMDTDSQRMEGLGSVELKVHQDSPTESYASLAARNPD